MNLRGNAVIELTDVNTGVVEQYEEENMVTNAILLPFQNNVSGMLYRENETSIGGTDVPLESFMVPICPRLISGVMLFHDPLTENVDNIFPPVDNLPFAFGYDAVNSSTNTSQGSFNATESGGTDFSYSYVWDFTTNQGNGTIAALALTTAGGGRGGYGNTLTDRYVFTLIKTVDYGMSDLSYYWDYACAVEINWEENYIVSIKYMNSKVLIKKVHVPLNKLGIRDSLNESQHIILEEQEITPSTFSFSNDYGTFLDGENGYWYGFRNTSNRSGTATLYWIKISKEDYSFTEGTWSFASTSLATVGSVNYSSSSETSMSYYRSCCIRGGYLYILSYGRTGAYKINLSNSADISLISFGFTAPSSYVSGFSYFQVVNNIIFGYNFMIMPDDTVKQTRGELAKLSASCSPLFQKGCFLLGFAKSEKYLIMINPLMFTINNLANTIEKTPDKTMKITYTLTEETSS